jgi:hypothetical protein
MYVLLYLHILTMFTAVALAAGSTILLLIAGQRGDRQLVAGLTGLPIDRVVPPLYILGGLFGLGTALAFGYSLVAPWMVIAYVLFAALTALGVLVSGPLMARIHAAASDHAGGEGALSRVMRRFWLDSVVSLAGIALLVGDMVFKPFS